MKKRVVNRFAFLPTKIEGKWVWLSSYIVVQEFKIVTKWVEQGFFTEAAGMVTVGEWIDISKSLG